MKKAVKLLALATAAILAALMLTGCGEKEAVEQRDPLTRAEATEEVITLPEGMDASAGFATQMTDTGMYIVFNGINKRETDYFTVPGGSLTILSNATGEATGMKSFKINLWKKVEGGAEYVDDSTIYYYTNGDMHTYTISDLDPAAQYRMVLSYDAYGYYIYGQMRVDGAAAVA